MISIIGGVLLCIGAFFTMQGKVYWAVLTYLFADVCWILLAHQEGNVMGLFFVVVGTTMGCIAYLKMRYGIMSKELEHGNQD